MRKAAADIYRGAKRTVANSDTLGAIPRHIARFCRLGPPAILQLLSETVDDWYNDGAPRLGAALAFYTIFSLTPLLIVVLAIASLAFGREAAEGQLVWQIQGVVGRRGAEVIQAVVQSARQPAAGSIATALSVLVLLFGATTAVAELRAALNQVWDVPQTSVQSIRHGVVNLLRERFFALVLVVGVGILLLASLFVNAWVSALGSRFGEYLPLSETTLQLVNFAVSFVVITVLFAAIYKIVPDVEIGWGDVAVGAAFTSLLFSISKIFIGMYLGRSGLASAYGAAGSLVLLLVWIYYSAQIFFLGAEFTQVYANRYGSRLQSRKRLWLPKAAGPHGAD